MQNSTSDKHQIVKNIEDSLKNKTILTIVFKDIENSHRHPQLVAGDSLSDSKFNFTGLLPPDFFGLKYTCDINEILGCGTYDIHVNDYKEIITNYLRTKD